MTKRALFLGLLGAALICGVTFYNDMVIRGSFLVGSYLPSSVFGSLILFLLILNPLLTKWHRKAAFTAVEIGIIVAMVLFACSIPGRGLMHHFTAVLMMPHHRVRTSPSWQGMPARFSEESVVDWGKLAAALAAPPDEAVGSTLDGVRTALAKEDEEALGALKTGEVPELDVRKRVVAALNGALADPTLPAKARDAKLGLANHVRRALPQALAASCDPEVLARVNRGILESSLEGAVQPRKPTVVEHVPSRMLADPSADPNALDGFVNGLATGDKLLSPGKLPWSAWRRALLFWVPVILTTAAMVIGLALVIHRQWSEHEKLPYPTVEFARALLPEEDGQISAVFRDRLFWLGAVPVFVIYLNNYARTWWPAFLIPIRTQFDFWPLVDYMPVFKRGYATLRCLFKPDIHFCAIGIAYFLATDTAFSLGIAPYLYALVTGIIAGYGITVGGAFLQPSISAFNHAGGYCAMFLVLLYTGRQYFTHVFRKAVGLASSEDIPPSAIWGGRVALAAGVLLVAQLAVVGIDVPLAILYVAGAIVIYVVASRLLAEVGLFKLQPFFFPCALLWGLLGVRAIGPDQLLMLGLVSSVLLVYPREAIMPFVVCGLQFGDRVKARLGALAGAGYGAFVIGLAVAIPVTLYIQYQYGAIRAGDGWSAGSATRLAFNATCTVRNQLAAQGALEQTLNAGAMERLTHIQPITPCLVGFAITFVLVCLFTFLRHRFSWWPLHPVMFLVLASWQSTYIAFSLLVGWVIKASVTKYGGAITYQRLRPLMIGLIAGELLGCLLPVVTGTLYYIVTGNPPPPFGFR